MSYSSFSGNPLQQKLNGLLLSNNFSDSNKNFINSNITVIETSDNNALIGTDFVICTICQKKLKNISNVRTHLLKIHNLELFKND